MKTPSDLAKKLSHQWHQADIRENRLLNKEAWPVAFNLGKPSATTFKNHPEKLRQHLDQWKQIAQGQVIYTAIKYQSASEAVNWPTEWIISKPSEWIAACNNRQVQQEYALYSNLLPQIDPIYHKLLIRLKSRVINTPMDELISICELSQQLSPGMANGKPLRALAISGIDTKFLEKNTSLLMRLLNVRYGDQLADTDLETWLNAQGHDRWPIIVPLSPGLLPFEQIRLRTSELQNSPLPANNLLIIENMQCVHLLPKLDDTIAILGAGFDLSWMNNDWMKDKKLAYWGDMDTWGLYILGIARAAQPHLIPLMMEQTLFEQLQDHTVVEPQTAPKMPLGLTYNEEVFFRFLLQQNKGRLEQEFIPEAIVHREILRWLEEES